MTPGKKQLRQKEPESSEIRNQMEAYKLANGLINMNLIQTGNLYQQNHAGRNSRSHHHVDHQRKSGKPRLTYARWNMMISSRYKTELCRQFDEEGFCHFDDKCLFAHGRVELRPIPRHPKYKTELCRDFHETGFCSFGPRCNFVHSTSEVGIPSNQSFFSGSDLTSLSLAAIRKSLPSSDTEASELSDAPFLDFWSTNGGLFGAIGESKIGTRAESDSDFQDSPTPSDHSFFR